LIGVLFLPAAAAGEKEAPNPLDPNRGQAARATFERRVKEYVAVHKAAADALPDLKERTGAAAIAAHQKALAEGIRARRAQARPGDVLGGEVAVLLQGLITAELATAAGAQETTEIQEQNPAAETPGEPVTLAVNAPYTEGASLSTVPPGLLQRLPPLPKQLDYRFVGHDLVLRDTVAHLIVDYLKNALP
jgi:hypothetical protein